MSPVGSAAVLAGLLLASSAILDIQRPGSMGFLEISQDRPQILQKVIFVTQSESDAPHLPDQNAALNIR